MPPFQPDPSARDRSEHKARTPQGEFGPELMAGLVHTVQTPLQSILINSEMLMELLRGTTDTRLREKGTRIISRIHREAASLQTIVRDFLALSRITAGQMVPSDVNAIIRETAEFMRNECLELDTDIVLDLDTSVYPVQLDRTLFSHALMNLVRNALEAIGKGGVIEITTRESSEFLDVEVRDDGRGIPPEVVDKLFQPFFTTKPGGTGLGLPIARKIAEMHGGTLFARPEKERGGTFVIRLPRGRFIDTPRDSRKEVAND